MVISLQLTPGPVCLAVDVLLALLVVIPVPLFSWLPRRFIGDRMGLYRFPVLDVGQGAGPAARLGTNRSMRDHQGASRGEP